MRELAAVEFEHRLRACSPEPLGDSTVAALYVHYRLLLRWNQRTSLIGPGTIEDLVEVHYGESLAALPLLGRLEGETLVDVGSGAGFPGVVLAAARPRARLVLVEAKQRKWSFLKAVALETGLRFECLLGSLDRCLPKGFPARVDYVTLRALKLPARGWRALLPSLAEGARILVWAGREDPEIPSTLRIGCSVGLPGTRWKRILELERSTLDPATESSAETTP